MAKRKVSTDDLRLGMYVSELDRPWLETPFLFQGFTVINEEELADLRKHCHYVYIDPERGAGADRYLDEGESAVPEAEARVPRYRDTATVEDELPVAREAHQKVSEMVGNVMEEIRAGRKINLDGVEDTVEGMIDSILRNPDAFMWLTKLKARDNYTYAHSVDSCALAITFGRHLGFSRPDLQTLAVGSLLFDVGKMKLPEGLLNKPDRLTEAERAVVRRHVDYSAKILNETRGVDGEVVQIALTHHERYNGQGYPKRLHGGQIPIFGRIAGIIDCYDAITSERPFQGSMSAHAAVKKLYEWRGVDFQEALVEQFIQSLGVYPTGTLVELSTGEVGVVISQSRVRRLRPKVMLILDPDKQPYSISPARDLMSEWEDEDGRPLEIAHAVEPGTHGVDPHDFFLTSVM
ncbi:MAG: HD-GYP domain-containing protein [Gammaproteobacteria bacterium]|nr:HD-GYP domain-containing protein [Gammaproteobacteria bacterium]